jgi:hypothetical protein
MIKFITQKINDDNNLRMEGEYVKWNVYAQNF